MSCTYFSCDFLVVFLLHFCPVYFKLKFIPVGSVCLGNTKKTRVAFRCRARDGTILRIFLTFEKCFGLVCCFLLHCFCDMSDEQTSSGFCVIMCGICFWTFLKSPGLFFNECLKS